MVSALRTIKHCYISQNNPGASWNGKTAKTIENKWETKSENSTKSEMISVEFSSFVFNFLARDCYKSWIVTSGEK
jgi:hypothetical protein